jgi:5-methylcytosine-specific restriction endonuclease McrA
MLSSPVLVLNLNYEPINVCNARRALLLIFRGKAELLTNGQGQVFSVHAVFDLPSVVRLVYMVKRPFAKRKLSKKEVLLRDRHTCQYCGDKAMDLTLDHVVPRRQGGLQSWENIVSACIPCNHNKAGRTPSEAGMTLLKRPKAPYPSPYYVLHGRTILEDWRPFIPWELE